MKSEWWLDAAQVCGVRSAPARAELHQRVAAVGNGGVGMQHQEHRGRGATTVRCDGLHQDLGDVVGDDDCPLAACWKLCHDRAHETLHLLQLPAQRK